MTFKSSQLNIVSANPTHHCDDESCNWVGVDSIQIDYIGLVEPKNGKFFCEIDYVIFKHA